MKGSSGKIGAVCALVMVLVLVEAAQVSMAVTCQVTELSPCAAAFSSSSKPSQQCCSKLKEQKPCYCTYLKSPVLKGYVGSPNAQKVASSCGVSIPKC